MAYSAAWQSGNLIQLFLRVSIDTRILVLNQQFPQIKGEVSTSIQILEWIFQTGDYINEVYLMVTGRNTLGWRKLQVKIDVETPV